MFSDDFQYESLGYGNHSVFCPVSLCRARAYSYNSRSAIPCICLLGAAIPGRLPWMKREPRNSSCPELPGNQCGADAQIPLHGPELSKDESGLARLQGRICPYVRWPRHWNASGDGGFRRHSPAPPGILAGLLASWRTSRPSAHLPPKVARPKVTPALCASIALHGPAGEFRKGLRRGDSLRRGLGTEV